MTHFEFEPCYRGEVKEIKQMNIHQLLVLGAAAFPLSVVPCHAGPCSHEIDRMQAQVDAKLGAKAEKGPEAPESAGALMHRQPTPGSIATAESRLGEVPPETVQIVASALARARQADRADDKNGCERALADVQRALGN